MLSLDNRSVGGSILLSSIFLPQGGESLLQGVRAVVIARTGVLCVGGADNAALGALMLDDTYTPVGRLDIEQQTT